MRPEVFGGERRTLLHTTICSSCLRGFEVYGQHPKGRGFFESASTDRDRSSRSKGRFESSMKTAFLRECDLRTFRKLFLVSSLW
jgi:hypothetical protein